MARPVQLRYDDVNDGETVIGTYLTDDQLIEDFSLKNSGSGEFTRIEVLGEKQLKENLPIDYSQYATSEPEILVYAYDDSGNWTLRDRVFPENQGVLDDDGNYRNDGLWGFQKWVGRQQVTGISESNSTITQILNSVFTSLSIDYVAQTPSGDTVPTLDNYTFNGKVDRAIRDLVRDFPVKIWFTAETDGSGNYIVKVQSKGFGGVVQNARFTDERQDAGYQIIEFEEEDKSNIVNKVEVEGTDNNGNKINKVVSDSSSISSHGERYIHRNVGYLKSSTQAQNIANDILSPQPSPHLEISIPFQDQNILNSSIDIKDDRFSVDAVYTVVKQRDFYTEGKTEVELGFEKNRSEERRDRDRELDERNHQLFPTSQTDVGNQDLTTGSALSDTGKTGGVGDSNDRNDDKSNVGKTGGVGDSNDRNDDKSNVGKTGGVSNDFINRDVLYDNLFFSQTISAGSTKTYSESSINTTAESDPGFVDLTVSSENVRDQLAVEITLTFDTGATTIYNKTVRTGFNGDYQETVGIPLSLEGLELQKVKVDVFNYSGQGDLDVSVALTVHAMQNHSHGDNISTDNQVMGLTDNVDTDNQSMGLTDNIDTDDSLHGGGTGDDQHGGSTENNVFIDLVDENKTDR